MRYAVLLLAGMCLLSCRDKSGSLPTLGVVPDFLLTDETAKEFSSQALDGNVVVADFIYTTCQGPCPRMSAQMRQLQTETKDFPDVRLVSFTVDPEHDTPEALAAYAKRYKAESGRWIFLTGSTSVLNLLSKEAFHLSDVDGKLEHSTRFVLIDRKSHIRGYYATWEPEAIKKLLADIKILRGQSL
jgi:protein SCO1/2